jgi:hypothetical protein
MEGAHLAASRWSCAVDASTASRDVDGDEFAVKHQHTAYRHPSWWISLDLDLAVSLKVRTNSEGDGLWGQDGSRAPGRSRLVFIVVKVSVGIVASGTDFIFVVPAEIAGRARGGRRHEYIVGRPPLRVLRDKLGPGRPQGGRRGGGHGDGIASERGSEASE